MRFFYLLANMLSQLKKRWPGLVKWIFRASASSYTQVALGLNLRGYFSASFSRISSVIFSGFGFFSGFCLLAFKYVKILSESWDLLQAIQNTLQVTYLQLPKS